MEQMGVMAGCSPQHVPQTGLSRELQSPAQILQHISIRVKSSSSVLCDILQQAGLFDVKPVEV